MSNWKVGVIGLGEVGRGVQSLFPEATVYDEPLGLGDRGDVNDCDVAFVCVPTPQGEDGSCDTSIVEDVVSWLEASVIVIRSTVAVGSTDRLRHATGKRIVFQPEYGPGTGPDHPFKDVRDIRWVILGGVRPDTVIVSDLYKTAFNADIEIFQTDSRTAELAKYMENLFLALKVTFCNEFYSIAEALDVDYNELRELWLLDPRMGRSHTFVLPESRGFGGPCLPKDAHALVRTAEQAGYEPELLQAMLAANQKIRALTKDPADRIAESSR